jgi:rhomboid protease GluP
LGKLLSLVVQGNQAVSAGASGAIVGLYGALLVFLWRERRQVDRHEFRWLFWAAIVFLALIFAMGIWVLPGIDNSAHVGGFAVGALLAKPWTPLSPRGRSGAGVALAVLVIGAGWLTWHIPPRYLLHDELQVQQAIQSFTLADQRISRQWDEILSTCAGPCRHRRAAPRLPGHLQPDSWQNLSESWSHERNPHTWVKADWKHSVMASLPSSSPSWCWN